MRVNIKSNLWIYVAVKVLPLKRQQISEGDCSVGRVFSLKPQTHGEKPGVVVPLEIPAAGRQGQPHLPTSLATPKVALWPAHRHVYIHMHPPNTHTKILIIWKLRKLGTQGPGANMGTILNADKRKIIFLCPYSHGENRAIPLGFYTGKEGEHCLHMSRTQQFHVFILNGGSTHS